MKQELQALGDLMRSLCKQLGHDRVCSDPAILGSALLDMQAQVESSLIKPLNNIFHAPYAASIMGMFQTSPPTLHTRHRQLLILTEQGFIDTDRANDVLDLLWYSMDWPLVRSQMQPPAPTQAPAVPVQAPVAAAVATPTQTPAISVPVPAQPAAAAVAPPAQTPAISVPVPAQPAAAAVQLTGWRKIVYYAVLALLCAGCVFSCVFLERVWNTHFSMARDSILLDVADACVAMALLPGVVILLARKVSVGAYTLFAGTVLCAVIQLFVPASTKTAVVWALLVLFIVLYTAVIPAKKLSRFAPAPGPGLARGTVQPAVKALHIAVIAALFVYCAWAIGMLVWRSSLDGVDPFNPLTVPQYCLTIPAFIAAILLLRKQNAGVYWLYGFVAASITIAVLVTTLAHMADIAPMLPPLLIAVPQYLVLSAGLVIYRRADHHLFC